MVLYLGPNQSGRNPGFGLPLQTTSWSLALLPFHQILVGQVSIPTIFQSRKQDQRFDDFAETH